MRRTLRHLRRVIAGRSGLTLLEVMIALGVFLIGSVGIVALFVTASVLHSDASNRRRASFIAEELLDQVNALRLRDVFAVTQLQFDDFGGTYSITADAVTPDAANYGALFDQYPLPMHDGAIKYYKEAGMWTPERAAKQKERLAHQAKLKKMWDAAMDEALAKKMKMRKFGAFWLKKRAEAGLYVTK